MSRGDAARTEEDKPMLKWLVLPVVVLAYLAATVSAGAPRDRDHDRLPDRWERKHQLSTTTPSAKRDPDRDRLRNRRELRLRTHPRRADTDRDRLNDGAEVRRFHTNPRKRDSDGDRFSDRCELRKGTNPRKRRSHPKRRCTKSPQQPQRHLAPVPPSGSPKPIGGLPDASNTGVPAGTDLTVHTEGIEVRRAGTVIDGVQAPYVAVYADNVTIRNSRLGGPGESFPIWRDNSSRPLTVEDTELIGDRGTCVNGGNATIRRVEMTGCENGAQAASGMTLVDSYIHDLSTHAGAHTDGVQFSGGAGNIVIRHNYISPQDEGSPASTSAIIMHTGDNPQNHNVRIEDNLLDGSRASITLYAPRHPASDIYINNNRFRQGVNGYTDSVEVPARVTEFNGNIDDFTGERIGG
jgi:Bacterial TSP3 repeat